MKKFLFALYCLLFVGAASAQTVSSTLGKGDMFYDGKPPHHDYGTITVNQDAKLVELVSRYIKHNDLQQGFAGWRVHLYFGSGYGAKEKANGIKTNFETDYPDIPVYIVYEAPYFKVRAGDFRMSEKNKAYRLKKSIEGLYPDSWIVADKINYPRLYPAEKKEEVTEEQ